MKKKALGRVSLIVLLAAVLAAAAIAVTLYIGSTRVNYTPPPLDELAVPIAQTPLADRPSGLSTQQYSVVLDPPLALVGEDICALNFANPPENKVWLLVDIRQKDTDLLLYRTGRVAPGMALTSLPMAHDAVEILQAEGAQTSVNLVVYSFALESFQSMGEIRLEVPLLTGSDVPGGAAQGEGVNP